MKINFVLTDDSGKQYEGIAELTPVRTVRKTAARADEPKPRKTKTVSLSYDLNLRAFMKRYGRGLKGPAKFTLLVARLARGEARNQVSFEQVKSNWNNMKTLMGGKFNPAHSTRAREHGWVDTPKRGVYVVSSSWKDALQETNA